MNPVCRRLNLFQDLLRLKCFRFLFFLPGIVRILMKVRKQFLDIWFSVQCPQQKASNPGLESRQSFSKIKFVYIIIVTRYNARTHVSLKYNHIRSREFQKDYTLVPLFKMLMSDTRHQLGSLHCTKHQNMYSRKPNCGTSLTSSAFICL